MSDTGNSETQPDVFSSNSTRSLTLINLALNQYLDSMNNYLAEQGWDVQLDLPLLATAASALVLFITIIYYATSQQESSSDQTESQSAPQEEHPSQPQNTEVKSEEVVVQQTTPSSPKSPVKVISPKRVSTPEPEEVVEPVVKTRSSRTAVTSDSTPKRTSVRKSQPPARFSPQGKMLNSDLALGFKRSSASDTKKSPRKSLGSQKYSPDD